MIQSTAYPLLLVAQALSERNPAWHLIWLFSMVAFALVGLIALLEALDWIRDRLSRPTADKSGRAASSIGALDSILRRRFFRRLPPVVRLWGQKMGSNDRWEPPTGSRPDRS